jgi:hypothetical protein
MSRTNVSTTPDDLGRRTSQDTMTTSSVTSSPSDSSGRHSNASTAATSVSPSPSEQIIPPKGRTALTLRKVGEMLSVEPLREGFETHVFRSEGKEEVDHEFRRRMDLALSEVEKLALEERDAEVSDDETEVPTPRVWVAV